MARVSDKHFLGRYLRETEGPWASLLLVLPLVVIYEASTRGLLDAVIGDAGPADQLVAFSLLRQTFASLGATGAMLPALTLVACLLGWHVAQRDAWTVRPRYLLGMTVEGAMLALPMIGLAMAMSRWMPCAAYNGVPPERLAVLAIGAAIYEELLFRLIAFVALHMILVDVIGVTRKAGDILTVTGGAALFAAYHYLGVETFEWPSFVFRTMAGMFLGAVFLYRGFGITALCHAAYDLVWVAILWRSGPL